MSREVMQQALDALEAVHPYTDSLICYASTIEEHPPNAIDGKVGRAITTLRAALAEPKQEPVAWRYQDARGHYRYRGYVPLFDEEYWPLKPVPLYTHPPQRKPLTDEKIVDILAHVSIDCDDQINIIEMARAIEAAHGIKQEEA